MCKVIDKAETDIHHVIWKCYKNQYNVYCKENKKRVPREHHVAYNLFVKDKQNPREALKIMYEMCHQVLSEDIRARLVEILYNTEDKDFYIPEVIKGGKKNKPKTQSE